MKPIKKSLLGEWIIILIFFLFVFIVLIYIFSRNRSDETQLTDKKETGNKIISGNSPIIAQPSFKKNIPLKEHYDAKKWKDWFDQLPLKMRIDLARQALSTTEGYYQAREIMDGLLDSLAAYPDRNASVNEIMNFLSTGKDIDTGLLFKVGNDHFLEEAPTLRVALIDLLEDLNIKAAIQQSEIIFKQKRSPDEYVLALRSMTKNPDGTQNDLILKRWLTLIGEKRWRNTPSSGYLHAMDVPVYLNDPSLIPLLSSQMKSGDQNRAVSHAAWMALERMVMNDPIKILEVFNNDNKLLNEFPDTRAGLFARLNPEDTNAAIVLENYLSRKDLSDDEFKKFIMLFPNNNVIDSNNLITESDDFSLTQMAKNDKAALLKITEWLDNNKFPHKKAELTDRQTFLKQQVNIATKNGYL